MREILFRGKRVDNGGWVKGVIYGEYMICGMTTAYYDDEIPMSKYSQFDYIEVIPETVGQYTGYKDEDGREIYEGDVVNAWGGEYCQGCWEFTHYSWEMKDIRFDIEELGNYENIKIIGNIWDNPQLKKKKEPEPYPWDDEEPCPF